MKIRLPTLASDRERGIALVLITMALFAGYDAISKYLTRFYPVTELLWARYVMHAVFMLAVFGPRMRLDLVRTHHPVLQIARSAFLVASTFLFMSGLRYLPLADATAINFVTPLLVTALSIPMLGEKVEARARIAVLVGFGGVLIIIRPGGGMLQLAAALPFLAACCSSLYQVFTRKYRRSENPITLHFYTGLIGVAATSIGWQSDWTMPTLAHSLLLVFHAFSATFGHYLLILAYQRIWPAAAAPFTYTQLVWSLLFGWTLYGEAPDAGSLFGIAVIVTSGMYVARRLSGRKAISGDSNRGR
ncbi:MAG: DMT family transporter [Candidatus Accumulibacter sp.]|jgi:drug/metabolite transporter (DMT)-like permease|nr:DMT family transporter [Accumulibacter sp.]